MYVIKRDKSEELFQKEKIEMAVMRAFESCGKEMDTGIIDCVISNYDIDSDEKVHVEDIQDAVERCLMDTDKEVAKAYIIYRYDHKLIRENKDKLYKDITKKLMASDVQNQNANVDEHSFGGRMGEVNRLVLKDYALKYCMSRKSRNNHLNNEIYIHDLDSYAAGMHNCCKRTTKFITDKGVYSFEDFNDGDNVVVLTHTGNFKNAVVKRYGVQKLNKIAFTRQGRVVEEWFTDNHRWLLDNGTETTNLNVGDKILRAPKYINFDFDTCTESEKRCWCLGFVLGDGVNACRWSHGKKNEDIKFVRLRLCGEKTQYSKRFDCLKHTTNELENGDLYLTFSSKINFIKEVPDFEQLSFKEIHALLDGLYCADGQKSGSVKSLFTSSEEIASIIRDYAPMFGWYITSEDDYTCKKTNYGIRGFSVNFKFTGENNKYSWVVTNIEEANEEEVWCLEVEEDHSFVLPNGLVTGNCLTIPFDDLLANGFNTRQTDVRPANSINTAFQLVAVLFQIQSLQQFGGVGASHLDWTMVPYVKKSFYKHFKKGAKYIKGVDINLDEYNDEMSIDDVKYTSSGDVYTFAMEETERELKQSVEGMYHNLNTLQSRSGCQLPFTSINYGTCTLPEGRMVTKALLNGSIDGVGKFHKTPIFPCGIFQMMSGVNRNEGEPNYDLFKLALKSTAQRLYPNYANCDWSNAQGYDKNDPKTYFSTMGCHAKDTPIIMADGTKKMIQDVVVGDKIMGVNNQVRTVESLIRGNDRLFKINQSRAESYVVNEGHILSLIYTSERKYRGLNKGDKINISVHDFLEIPYSSRRFFNGYKSSYELSEKEFPIPPYILGLWLGDGNSSSTRFSVNINETQIIEDLGEYATSIGKKLTIREDSENCLSVDVCDSNTMSEGNVFRQGLIKLNLIGNKHIPEEYFYGSKEQRSALLAGLLNTDGWGRNGRGRKSVCFGNTNINLIEGAKRIADSLGYNTNIIKARGETIGVGICEGSVLKPYYHLNIHSYDDPHLMEHKRSVNSTSNRNFDTSTITVEEVEPGDFYGFELDGDRLYLINDGTVTHNCRTANLVDINGFGQLKDGRGNICPVTIILPTLAMEAKEKVVEKATSEDRVCSNDEIVAQFMKLLTKKIEEAKDMLVERFDWICSQSPASANFMWENNTMAGYVPEEGVRSALKHGTLAMGQLGMAETLQILIQTDHTTEKGMELAKEIETLFSKKCKEYKENLKLNFAVYYTPAENLCYTAMNKFRDKYGVIENVSDREYFTNSIHVPVWYDMNPFEKIDIESKLTGYSTAGCITYVELPSTAKNNIDALEKIVTYAMDKDIPYFAINVPVDNCECGYSDEIGETCPICGSSNIQRLRRVTGYLTGDYKTAFNKGKQAEVRDRVKHVKEFK